MKLKILATVVSLSLSAVAVAQNAANLKDPRARHASRTDANGKPITVVDFDDANIEGSAKAPTGFVLQSRESSSFRNLIELRRNFRPQIEASQLAVSVQ